MPLRPWLKDTERRPDPTPVATDDRKPMIVGTIGWLVALVLLLTFSGPLGLADQGLWHLTCGIGLALGLFGLLYTARRHRRNRRR